MCWPQRRELQREHVDHVALGLSFQRILDLCVDRGRSFEHLEQSRIHIVLDAADHRCSLQSSARSAPINQEYS